MNTSSQSNQIDLYNQSENGFADADLRLGFYTKLDDYSVMIIFTFISTAGIVLNFGSICIIQYGENSSKEVKLQLLNIAICDLIFAAFVPLEAAKNILDLVRSVNVIILKILEFIGYTVSYASLLLNLIIALERFFLVYLPFRFSSYKRKHKIVAIVTAWIFSAATQIYDRVFDRVCYTSSRQPVCQFRAYDLFTVVKSIVPVIGIMILYVAVFIKLRIKPKVERCASNVAHNKDRQVSLAPFTHHRFICQQPAAGCRSLCGVLHVSLIVFEDRLLGHMAQMLALGFD